MKIKLISLHQPWASMVVVAAKFPEFGKHCETRDWATSYRGPLAIHASKGMTEEDMDCVGGSPFREALELIGIHGAAELPRGLVVAVARIKAVIDSEDFMETWEHPHLDRTALSPSRNELEFGNYDPNRKVWILRDILALDEPVPARGMPGLPDWEVPAALEAKLRAAGTFRAIDLPHR